MFYTEWLVNDEAMVAAVAEQVTMGVHASNSALKDAGMPFAFQLAFPRHNNTRTGACFRVFAKTQELLVMLMQHERVKPLRRVPGVENIGILAAPETSQKGAFVRARDADGRRLGRGRNERKPKPYFEVNLRSQKTKRAFRLRIRLVREGATLQLNSYGLGGEGVPLF